MFEERTVPGINSYPWIVHKTSRCMPSRTRCKKLEEWNISLSLYFLPYQRSLEHKIFEEFIFWRPFDEQKIGESNIRSKFAFKQEIAVTSFKMRQCLYFWNCSKGEIFLGHLVCLQWNYLDNHTLITNDLFTYDFMGS